MPGKGTMFRMPVLTIALALAATTTHAQQMPAQPPPANAPFGLGQGNPQERSACHPDVTKYCQVQLEVNPNDVLGILGCLQTNRAKISHACQQVLASHGQ
jgi:hypothetical protein